MIVYGLIWYQMILYSIILNKIIWYYMISYDMYIQVPLSCVTFLHELGGFSIKWAYHFKQLWSSRSTKLRLPMWIKWNTGTVILANTNGIQSSCFCLWASHFSQIKVPKCWSSCPGRLCSLLLWRLPPQVEGQTQRHVWKDLVTSGWTLEFPFHPLLFRFVLIKNWNSSECTMAHLYLETAQFRSNFEDPFLGLSMAICSSKLTSMISRPIPNWFDTRQHVKTRTHVTFWLSCRCFGFLKIHKISWCFTMLYLVTVKSPTGALPSPRALRNCAIAPTQDRHGTSEACNQSSPSTAEPSKGGAPQRQQWNKVVPPPVMFVSSLH